MKTINRRLSDLERSGTGNGLIYFVMVADGVFTLKENGADVIEDLELTEAEFAKWENTKGPNDCIFVIRRRDAVKDESDV
jgi:hypothetical protein